MNHYKSKLLPPGSTHLAFLCVGYDISHQLTKYCYDGGNVIAEYDGNNKLIRKYIYGPRVDEPVCMLDVVDNNAAYYYHYDGLGSVVALSDSDADTVQTYEYSVYDISGDIIHIYYCIFSTELILLRYGSFGKSYSSGCATPRDSAW